MHKTLFVMFDFPPGHGGAMIYNWDMVRALPKEKVVILAPKWSGWKKFDAKSGYKTYRLPYGWMEKMKIPIIVFAVLWIEIHESIKQIWFSKYSRTQSCITFFTTNFLRSPFGMTVYGEDLTWAVEDFYLNAPRIAKRLRDSVVSRAGAIVTNSHFSGSLLPAGRNYRVIHPCTSEIPQKIESSLKDCSISNSESDYMTYFSIGATVPKKGFDLVLRALALGLPGVKRYRYVIAGTGEAKESLMTLSKELCIDDIVEFCGRVSNETKEQLFRQADVFVMPSRHIEGFGIVFLEAASYGLCTVASRVGGIPEAVEDGKTGLLIENENVEELRKALALLGRDKDLRKQLGTAARKRCQSDFLWERFAREWISFFHTWNI